MPIFIVQPDYKSKESFDIFYIRASDVQEAQERWAQELNEDSLSFIQSDNCLVVEQDSSLHKFSPEALKKFNEENFTDEEYTTDEEEILDNNEGTITIPSIGQNKFGTKHDFITFNFINISCSFYRKEIHQQFLRENRKVFNSRVYSGSGPPLILSKY